MFLFFLQWFVAEVQKNFAMVRGANGKICNGSWRKCTGYLKILILRLAIVYGLFLAILRNYELLCCNACFFKKKEFACFLF